MAAEHTFATPVRLVWAPLQLVALGSAQYFLAG